MKEVVNIDVFSLAKLLGILNGLLGLIFGALLAIGSLLRSSGESFFFSIAIVIVLPLFYGGVGAIVGFLTGLLYNVVARWVGGIKIQLK